VKSSITFSFVVFATATRSEFEFGKQLVLTNNQSQVLSILRSDQVKTSLLAINLGAQPVDVTIETGEASGIKTKLKTFDLLSSAAMNPLSPEDPNQSTGSANRDRTEAPQNLQIYLKPFEVRVLCLERDRSPRAMVSSQFEPALANP
jgi:hypothetical protein